MKFFKKMLPFMMVLAICLSIFTSAFAAAVNIDRSKTGSLTIYKYDLTTATGEGVVVSSFVSTGEKNTTAESALSPYAIQGVQFTYLKVADITGMTTTNTIGANVSLLYGFTTDTLLSCIGLSYGDAYSSAEGTYYFTADMLNQAITNSMSNSTAAKDVLEAYIKANGGTTMAETDANGYSSASGLDLGLYLIVETYVPEFVTRTVNPFFVSVPMTTVDGSSWNYDLTLYPKNETGNPTLDKLVREGLQSTGKTEDYEHNATASVGDVVDYQIVSQLPTITSAATYLSEYTYKDILSKGIAYNTEDVIISFYTDSEYTQKITSWDESDGKFAVAYSDGADGGSVMTIIMTESGLSEINSSKAVYSADSVSSGYSNCYMVISYSCTLNNDAVLGDSGNPNTVTLTWRRTNTVYYDTLKSDCHVYSYGIDLLKKFRDANDNDAEGNFTNVKFILRNATDNYYVIADLIDGSYKVTGYTETAESATTLVPSSTGKIIIRGLEDDTYFIQETATDSGYQLLADEVKVEITTAEGDDICDICKKAYLTASAKVNDIDVDMTEDGTSIHAYAPLTIINNHGFDLPPTGATGTWLYSVLGVCGMASCVAVLIFVLRHKKETA